MEFYSVKHRKKVSVPDSNCKKKVFNVKGKGGTAMTRYAAVAQTTVDGDTVNLTKFVSKDVFDKMDVPMA